MIGKILIFLLGVILGGGVILIATNREQPRFSYALRQPIVISNGSTEFKVPGGVRLLSTGKISRSHDVGNTLYAPVAFSPEETAEFLSDELKGKSSDSFFIKNEKSKP